MTPGHRLSDADRDFVRRFESGEIEPLAFDHRSHVRLAYAYLTERDAEQAVASMRSALVAYLEHHGVTPAKYHETMTRAWVLAVRHFMQAGGAAESADAFMDANPQLLDSGIMLTHYSADLLFSDRARGAFVEPDVSGIPRHE